MTPNHTQSPPKNPEESAVLIDARGHRCPVPTLRLRRALERTPANSVFQLWTDDPMAQIDIPHFCNQNNYLLLSSEGVDGAWLFVIRREP